MKSLGKFPDRFLAEIAGQPDALRRAGEGLTAQQPALDRLAAASARASSVLFTGMGSSYDACYAPVTALAARGVRAAMVDTAELVHFRSRLLTPDTTLVAVSQSGESAELVRLAEVIRRRDGSPTLVSVTNGLRNTLARAADIALDTRAGDELGPSTMTFAGALAVLAAVAGDGHGHEQAARAAERLLADSEGYAERLAAWLGGRATLALLARGGARAAAEMGALTLKEAARFPAESLQTAQFRHGPLELAGPGLAAVVFATEPATRDLDLGLAAELVTTGAAVLVVSEDGAAPEGGLAVATGAVAPGLSPAVAIVPVQLLAWRLARGRGLTPGEFGVASKVTTRE